MRTVRRQYWKYVSFLSALTILSACGGNEPETIANPQEPVTVMPSGVNGEVTGEPSDEDENIQPTEQPIEIPEDESTAQPAEAPGQEGNRVIRDLSSEEWDQMEQDETLIMIHSQSGGKYYIDPADETVYYREVYAHERADGSENSYFHPSYSSASDDTMFAPGGTDENGKQIYDVYFGKVLVIRGLTIAEGADEHLLDVCYDVETGEVLILTYHKDPEKKQEGFMIYHASENDTCVQPLRFYPILTGEDYQELVYHDWIWSAILTPKAIYYDILPVQRIDLETGEVMEWGLTKEEYMDVTGIDNPICYRDTKAAGSGYIMTIVSNPDPAYDDMPENTVDTYLIYTEDGELAYTIPYVY